MSGSTFFPHFCFEPPTGRTRCPRSKSEGGLFIRLPALLIIASTALLASLDLPLGGPVPEPRPDAIKTPGDQADESTLRPGGIPDNTGTSDGAGEDAKEKQPEPYIPPPIEKEDAALFSACTAELKAMGAEFVETERIDDGDGCGIDRPIEMRTLGNGVALSPPGIMRCRTAVNLARWTRDIVAPMLGKAQPKETLGEVDQASAYVCRKRNGADTGRISEHARGNAVDIAGFTFKSGRSFTVAPREEEPTLNGAFQRAITSTACLYFSTVLDPGSDKAHETHLHLDTLKRKAAYRYCW